MNRSVMGGVSDPSSIENERVFILEGRGTRIYLNQKSVELDDVDVQVPGALFKTGIVVTHSGSQW
jgi:hypothetical protein